MTDLGATSLDGIDARTYRKRNAVIVEGPIPHDEIVVRAVGEGPEAVQTEGWCCRRQIAGAFCADIEKGGFSDLTTGRLRGVWAWIINTDTDQAATNIPAGEVR